MPEPFLTLRGISKSFDGNLVLKDIALEISPGDIVGLVGENGAGKSTCMNIISGNLQPSGGSIAIEGQPIRLSGVRDGLARGIRFIHQELSLVPSQTVAENIFLGHYLSGRSGWVNRWHLEQEAAKVLQKVRASHIAPGAEVGTLRAGDQQLVEIAKALTEDPRLLIMDEPTSSLTEHEAGALFDLVRALARSGTAVIFITHRLEEVIATCTRVVVFRDGTKVSDRPAPVTRDEILSDMIGKSKTVSRRRQRPSGAGWLKVENVSDGELSPIAFGVGKGEILGVFGLVGSGRTELLETLYGTRQLHQGTVSTEDGTRPVIRMVTESRKTSGILPTHSVAQNITLSSLPSISRLGLINTRSEDDLARRMRDAYGVRAAALTMPITALSGGNQQKALLARAFAARPDLLLLDEPTHGVDVGAKDDIYELIEDAAESGVTVIVASSEVPELMRIADRCLVLCRMQLAGVLDANQMTESEMLKLAFSGH